MRIDPTFGMKDRDEAHELPYRQLGGLLRIHPQLGDKAVPGHQGHQGARRAATWSPAATGTVATTPANGAVRV